MMKHSARVTEICDVVGCWPVIGPQLTFNPRISACLLEGDAKVVCFVLLRKCDLARVSGWCAYVYNTVYNTVCFYVP